MLPLRALPLLLALSCASYAKLEPDKATSMSLRLGGGGSTVCVNDADAHLVAEVVYRDGKRRETWSGRGSKSGKLRFDGIDVDAGPAALDAQGRIRFPPRLDGLDQPLTVSAHMRGRPIAAALTLRPRFDCGGVAWHGGQHGSAGDSATGGGDGARGPSIRVALARIDTRLNGRLLLVRVSQAPAPPAYYLVDTRGPAARFAVSAAGGDGGAGGEGSSGSSGSDGSDGSNGSDGGDCQDGGHGTSGSDGEDGEDGDDGTDGGDGGAGGHILVEYAPGDAALVNLVDYVVRGGAGGAPGSGGSGGSGGDGGTGGRGGRGGRERDSSGNHCSTSDGSAGADGRDGSSGSSGDDGRAGRPGIDGSIHARPVAQSSLWAAEIAAGVPIVIESPDR